jgi:hypothetical protein
MSKDIYDSLEDAEFDDAEQQLRHYGFGHIEREDEGCWYEMVYILRQYYEEHEKYPTEDEFRELWRQDCEEQIKLMEKILGRGMH